MAPQDDQLVRQVNRLYWSTEASVADIADQLDISRRALYDAIQPAEAEGECPECGGQLEYRNRTAKQRREAECPDCGREEDLDAAPAPAEALDPSAEEPETEQEDHAGARMPLDVGSMDAARGLWLTGAVLAGAALGAVVGLLGRRHD